MKDFIDLAEVLPHIDTQPRLISAPRRFCEDCGKRLDWSEERMCVLCWDWSGRDPIEWVEEEV